MMSEFLFYLLKVNIALIVLFGLYKVFFDKDTFFTIRRFVLMGIALASLLLPLIPFGSITPAVIQNYPQGIITVQLSEVAVGGESISNFSWIQFLGTIYLIVALFFIVRLLANLIQLTILLCKSPKAMIGNTLIHELPHGMAPFSFFHFICLSPTDYTPEQLTEIMRHEQTHSRQLHSIDIVFIQLMIIFCWFNPFAWLMLREIRINHEYLADESVIQTGADKKTYSYHLLQSTYPKQAAANLYSNFNVLPLKKRIMMLNKKRSRSTLIWKYLMFVPVIAMLCMIVNCTNVQDEKAVETEKATVSATDEMQTESAAKTNSDEVFDSVEQMPEFPGGMQALMSYLKDTIKYPEQAKKDGIQGRVIVQFIVEKSGKVTDIHVVRGIDPILDEEAARVVAAMPDWKPGMNHGEAVNVKYTIPVNFKLD